MNKTKIEVKCFYCPDCQAWCDSADINQGNVWELHFHTCPECFKQWNLEYNKKTGQRILREILPYRESSKT